MSECQGCGAALEPSRTRPRKWCSDRCRKQTLYSTPCVDCGAPTSADGARHRRCASCWAAHQHETRRWTPETVVAALQDWARNLGRTPAAPEGLRADAPVLVSIVRREFGSWSAGLRAAGLEPRPTGRPPKDDQDLCREIADRYEAGETSLTLAEAYGCSYSTILYRVRKAGGRIRPRFYRPDVRTSA